MKQNKILSKTSQISLGLIISLLGVFSATIPTQAAEQVILKYSILRESISVKELSTLANTGEVSSSLNAYLKLANKQPEELRGLLNNNVDVDPVTVLHQGDGAPRGGFRGSVAYGQAGGAT